MNEPPDLQTAEIGFLTLLLKKLSQLVGEKSGLFSQLSFNKTIMYRPVWQLFVIFCWLWKDLIGECFLAHQRESGFELVVAVYT